ncbi:MAG: acyl-CoA dehydrogenase family protein [bacterium]|nr:acyl-CoA dehydrogenase family protein [bacterium]
MIFSEEHLATRASVRKRMGGPDIQEMIKKYEKHGAPFAWEFVQEMAKLGLTGINIPEEYGGQGADNLSGVIAMMEMSRIWSGGALILAVGNSLVSYPLSKFGAPHQKNKWLPDLAAGKILGSFCLTEPDHGSDAAHLRTSAKVSEKGWLISGDKCFITNAPIASFLTVFCRTSDIHKDHKGVSAFLVPVEKCSELFVREPDEKEGLHAAHMGSLNFAEYPARFDSLLGEYEKGFSIAMKTLEHGRNWIAAQATGGLERAGELVDIYSEERTTFGLKLSEHSSIYDVSTALSFSTDVSKMLLFYSVWLEDQKKNFGSYASLAKLFSSETLSRLKSAAQQIHGGSGYLLSNEICRIATDGDVFPIYEGASNVQRSVILKAWLEDRLQIYPRPPYTHLFANLKDEARELGGIDALKSPNQRDLFAIADVLPWIAAWHLFENVFSKEWPSRFMRFQNISIFSDLLLEQIELNWPHKEKRKNNKLWEAARGHLTKPS